MICLNKKYRYSLDLSSSFEVKVILINDFDKIVKIEVLKPGCSGKKIGDIMEFGLSAFKFAFCCF